ncbi:ATP-dependent protease, putative [Plasmodium malariae]|uniref:ATP-dependent protease, putative n=1 Tax=Plasmodium malariae TaxID=5858 RepID=A0A1A8WEV8_PLAMA|nr:ATP-dependent protease, putative [Plasmodium malariae]SBS89720.1 ATP-dependent protease, putative [Plasmodium malariae]SCP02788.1 ATP-dependent protease, putative [Plasmodium malariae]
MRMSLYFGILKCRGKDLFKNNRFFYRSSKHYTDPNDIELIKEVKSFSLLNKPLFPGLSYVLNCDKSIVKIFENYEKKISKNINTKINKNKIYVGLFFSRKIENEYTYNLLNDDQFSGNFPLKGKESKVEDNAIIRKDIDYIDNLSDIYEYGCIGCIRHVLEDETMPNEEALSKEVVEVAEIAESEEGVVAARTANKRGCAARIGKNSGCETRPCRYSDSDSTESTANHVRTDASWNKHKIINGMNLSPVNKLGCVCRIVVEVLEKVRIKKWKGDNVAEIDIVKNERRLEDRNNKKIKVYQMEIVDKIKEIIKLNSVNSAEYNVLLKYYNIKNVHNLVNYVGNVTINKRSAIQSMFEKNNLEDQLEKCIQLLNEDMYMLKMKKELTTMLNDKFEREKKEIILKEHIANLTKMLGQKSEHEIICESFLNKYNSVKHILSDEVATCISHEINKFLLYNEKCNDYSSTHQYLHTVLNIPYGKYAPLNVDINKCEMILHKSHYGLTDVKRYILEYLGLYILNKNVKPKILLLVGYPGIGKTSICSSISTCLNIPQYLINMNNIHNMNDLIGHRKTYVNSYEGKIVHALISTKVMNPLIILDEFDKISFTNASIYNTFLNIFDMNQNKFFRDQYINIPLDISNVFFICTANSVDNIPDVLLDRMEIIYIYPYTNIEKVHIFKYYLKKTIQVQTSITSVHLDLSDDLLLYIIQNYTNENGIRQLYSILYNIYKRRAYMLLKGVTKKIQLHMKNLNILNYFISLENIRTKKNIHKFPCFEGTVKSLAFTDSGGQIVTIEVTSLTNKTLSNNASDSVYSTNQLGLIRHGTFRNETSSLYYKRDNLNTDGGMVNNMHSRIGNSPYINKVNMFSDKYNSVECISNANHYGEGGGRSIYGSYSHNNDDDENFNIVREENNEHSTHISGSYLDNRVGNKTVDLIDYRMVDETDYRAGDRQICREQHKKRNSYMKNGGNQRRNNSNCNIIITGNVGKIMQESIIIANTYSSNLLNKILPHFEKEYLHINLSECDIKKDGPSAGINFVTSILSYYLKIVVDNSICMTGEINLNGSILKIGGLMEKIILAKNFGIRTLIIPTDNAQECELLPQYIKENIRILYVYHYHQIFNLLFNKYERCDPWVYPHKLVR